MSKILIDRSTVEQALEALEMESNPTAVVEVAEGRWELKSDLAITALRAALAEPPVDDPHRDHWVVIAEAAQKIAASTECGLAEVKALCAALDRLTDAALAEPTVKESLQVESAFAENATTQQQLEEAPTSDYRRGYWDGFEIGKREGRIEAENALAEPQEPVGFKDAPERIWLQACEDDHCEVPFREHDEITWCAEQQNPLDVQYVRADLAAPPKRPAQPVQEPFGYFRAEPFGWTDCAATDEGAIPLYAGTRETLRLVDELALCAELKREYQEQFAQAAAQRDALLEALKLIDKEFKKHGRHHWPEAVKARAAIKQAEGENT